MKKPHSPETITGAPVVHGAYARPTRSRRVRKHRRRFLGFLLEGYPTPAPREQLLISTTADLMVRINEANAWIDQHGLVDNAGQPAPVIKTYVALLNAFRRNLEVLGMVPPTEPPVSLTDYLEAHHQAAPDRAGATIAAADDGPTAADAEEATGALSPRQPAPRQAPGTAHHQEDDR